MSVGNIPEIYPMRNSLKVMHGCHHHYATYVDDLVDVNPELIILLFCSQGHSMFKAVLKMNRDGGKGSKKETGMSRECELDVGFGHLSHGGGLKFKALFGNIHMNKKCGSNFRFVST